jgi:hypothetical protein
MKVSKLFVDRLQATVEAKAEVVNQCTRGPSISRRSCFNYKGKDEAFNAASTAENNITYHSNK